MRLRTDNTLQRAARGRVGLLRNAAGQEGQAACFDGRDVATIDADGLSRLRGESIGFVFQSFNLLPRLSAVENVELTLVYRGVARDERRARALEGVVQYRPGAVPPLQPPLSTGNEARESGPERRTRRRRRRGRRSPREGGAVTATAEASDRDEAQGESFEAGERSDSGPEPSGPPPVFDHHPEEMAGDRRTESARSESEERVAQSTDSTSRDIS